MYLETVCLPPDFTIEGRKFESVCHFHDKFILVNLRYVGHNTYFCKNYCFPQVYELIEDPEMSAELATAKALDWYFSLGYDNFCKQKYVSHSFASCSADVLDFFDTLINCIDYLSTLPSPSRTDGVTIDDLNNNHITQLLLNF